MTRPTKPPKTYAYIDASNLFYGGQKSLGWSIDYRKLADYLKQKYNCKKLYYFGGIETYHYEHDYVKNETVDLMELLKYLRRKQREHVKKHGKENPRIAKCIQRAKFYKKLQKFGFHLILRPVKIFRLPGGGKSLKANCDIEMALMLTTQIEKFDQALVLTGDGDFLPAMKFVRHRKKPVLVLARAPRTAKEIKKFAGANFRDFEYLKFEIGQGQAGKKNK